jgi:hypothetical protein
MTRKYTGPITAEHAALIKGMLLRGDRQSDIAACFLVNSGRIAEIHKGKGALGQTYKHTEPAPADTLPPAGPYLSFFELWRAKRSLWRVRLALEDVEETIQKAMVVIHKAEEGAVK